MQKPSKMRSRKPEREMISKPAEINCPDEPFLALDSENIEERSRDDPV
jgi:hypothetical protein